MRNLRRWCALILAVVMVLSILPSAALTASASGCEHNWIDGYCILCGESCSHEWTSDGYCTLCDKECNHDWMDSCCMTCGMQCFDHMWADYGGYTYCQLCNKICEHEWSNTMCTICNRFCDHPEWDTTTSTCVVCGEECTVHFWMDGVCANCGRECKHDWSNGTCSICEMSMGCEHNWENSVCTLCGVTCTHSWKDGTCTVCGKKCTAHSWSNGACSVCGKKCAHTWKDSVCTICGKECTSHSWSNGVCTVCGKKCTSHSWSNGACSVCGKACIHSWKNGVCTVCGIDCPAHSWSNGICTVCGKVCAHSWNSGEITTAPTENAMGVKTFTCTTCGATITESIDAKGHSYQNGICADCGIYQEAVLVTMENRKSLGLSSSFVGYYAIGNAGQLMWFSDKVRKAPDYAASDRGMKVVLIADISLKDVDYTPPAGRYRGVFDGNGHTISDMTLTSEKAQGYVSGSYPHYEYLGLFCRLYMATVQNLTIKGSITLTDGTYYSGAVAGEAQISTIRNVDSYVTFTNTTDSLSIQYPGGIVGCMFTDGSKIQNCRFYGSITLDYAFSAAGIAGSVGNLTTVSDCTNYGNIDIADGGYAAGIAGHARNGAVIERCLNVGSVELDAYCAAAGILAEGYYTFTVRDCGNVGTIIARPTGSLAYVSGIVAIAGVDNDAPSSVTGCYNIGTVKDETNPNSKLMGVIVGSISKGSDYSSGLSDATVSGNYYLQGTTPFYLNSTAVTSAAGTAITSSQVTSGELAYRLNGSKNAGLWKQTLGTDKYPNFTGENVNYSSKYYNSHNYVNGSCTGCGAACSHSWSSGACTVCGLACAHPSYTDGKCTVCGLTCTHKAYVNGFCDECDAYQQPSGSGAADDPYLIENAGQLYWFAAKVNSKATPVNAKLTADITVNPGTFSQYGTYTPKNGETPRLWKSIGCENVVYRGTFDGNGKTVSGLYYSGSPDYSIGFFGTLNGGATVKNLGIVNSLFSVSLKKNLSVLGGLAADVYDNGGDVLITGCYSSVYVTVTDTADEARVGGLLGYIGASKDNKITITDCYNAGMVKGTGSASVNVGGLIGNIFVRNSSLIEISECYNTGGVIAGSSSYGYAGGLIGSVYETCTVTNCYNTGNVTASGSEGAYAGGLMGEATSDSIIISNCYSIGTPEASARSSCYVGGVLANNSKRASLENCYYLAGTAEKGVANGDGSADAKSADEFASGEIAWLLNCQKADGVWKQTLGTDAAPNFTSKTVYYGYNTCFEDAAQRYGNEVLSATPLAHSWSEGICTVCEKEHDDHSWAEGICTVCGKQHDDHSWPEGICTVCGKVCTHSWNDGEVTTDPTCAEEGVKTFICTICGGTKTEPVAVVDHTWSNGTCSVCGLACEHESYDNGFCKVCDLYQQPSGSGTESEPYLIENAGQLYWFAARVNSENLSACAKLMADIIVNPGTFDTDGNYTPKDGEALRSWSPIGYATYLTAAYFGTFDGNGKTVSGLYYKNNTRENAGMFCILGDKAVVKNLGVLNSFFRAARNVGALAGAAMLYDTTSTQSIEISGCYTDSIARGDYYVGGLIGTVKARVENVLTIENCYTTGRVIGTSKIGGLIAAVDCATVRNCYSTASLNYEAASTTAELFAAVTSDGKMISNCYFVPVMTDSSGIAAGSAAVAAKTKAQFASGEVAWLLNGQKADGVWKQTLGENGDALPSFKGETVYFGYDPCKGEYANQPFPYDQPQHNWSSGVCTLCGEVCKHESYENGICTACGEECLHENYDNGFCGACDIYQQPEGSGTMNAPYLIANAGQLYWFAAKINSSRNTHTGIYAKLTADITINKNVLKADGTLNGDGKNFRLWTPIGNTQDCKYNGVFDGDGHTISGLYYSGGDMYVGLFGIVEWVTITNLTLSDSYFVNDSNTDTYIGRLVGFIKNTSADIRNCGVAGTLIATVSGNSSYLYAGGLIGRADTGATSEITIRNCYASGSLTASFGATPAGCKIYAGGLLGSSSMSLGVALYITNCYSTCAITADNGAITGGVIGYCFVDDNILSIGNAYYLETDGLDTFARIDADDGATVVNEAKAMSAYQFANGEVAWLLNGETSEATEEAPLVWKQTLGTDAAPNFTGKTVYYGHYTCANATEKTYSNDPLSDQPMEHTWSNGICSVCGKECLHESYDNGFCETCGAYQQPSGSGTTSDPYLIKNAGNLYWFAAKVNNNTPTACAKLDADIIVNPGTFDENGGYTPKNGEALRSWTPIGNGAIGASYAGTFDGNGKTVSGLYVNDSSVGYAGLFGIVNGGATLKNIGVLGSYFCGDYHSGALAAMVMVETTHVAPTVQISGCYSNSVLSGNYYVGGLIGSVGAYGECTLTVENCYSTGSVKGNKYVGGLIGDVLGAAVRNCYSTGSVTASSDFGAIFGQINYETKTVTNCYYLTGAASTGVGSGEGGVTAKTSEQFASGEVAWLLNGEEDNGVWKQTLGEKGDATPNFTGKAVYCAYKTCAETDTDPYYTNDADSAGHPAHSWENSVCTACGKNCTYHSWGTDGICTVCGKLCDHDWFNGVCKVCDLACEHTSWSKNEEFGYLRCDNCALCQVEYITCDADGSNRKTATTYAQELSYFNFEGGTMTLESGWYVVYELIMSHPVYSGVKYDSDLKIQGEVNLIVPDTHSVVIDGEVSTLYGLGQLNIYAQSEGDEMGMVYFESDGISVNVDLTVNGGWVDLYSDAVNGRAMSKDYTLTVNGGIVSLGNGDENSPYYKPYDAQPILNGGILVSSAVSYGGVFAEKPKTKDGSCWKVLADTEYHDLVYSLDESSLSAIPYDTYSAMENLEAYKTIRFEPCTQHVANPDAVGYPMQISSTTHALCCLYCGTEFQEKHTFTDGTCACGISEARFDSSLEFMTTAFTMGSDLNFVFIMNSETATKYPTTYVEIVVNGIDGITTTRYDFDDFVQYGSVYRVEFDGIAAKNMGDSFTATIYGINDDGTQYIGVPKSASIADHLKATVRKSTSSAAAKKLAVDMLNYGAAAQVYFDYDTAHLVNSDLTTEELAYGTQQVPSVSNTMSKTAEGTIKILTPSVTLESKVVLNILFDANDYTGDKSKLTYKVIDVASGEVVLSGTPVQQTGTVYRCTYDDVGASRMRSDISIGIYDENDQLVSQVQTWSVESYIAEILGRGFNNTKTEVLLENMIKYGDSAAAYLR